MENYAKPKPIKYCKHSNAVESATPHYVNVGRTVEMEIEYETFCDQMSRSVDSQVRVETVTNDSTKLQGDKEKKSGIRVRSLLTLLLLVVTLAVSLAALILGALAVSKMRNGEMDVEIPRQGNDSASYKTI